MSKNTMEDDQEAPVQADVKQAQPVRALNLANFGVPLSTGFDLTVIHRVMPSFDSDPRGEEQT